MVDSPHAHNRQSMRWRGFDYASEGTYFVTICTQGGRPLLGMLQGQQVTLGPAGTMVAQTWEALSERFDNLAIRTYIVMPNHFHGLLILSRNAADLEPEDWVFSAPITSSSDDPISIAGTVPDSLGRIIQAFKSLTTHAYICGVRSGRWPPFEGRLWQRGYHDRVVRNLDELGAIENYIRLNPAQWAQDPYRP